MRWLILVFVGSLSGTSMLEAVNRGLAGLYYQPVKEYLGEPGIPAQQGRLSDSQAAELIARARHWDGENPDVVSLEARIISRKIAAERADRYFWQPVDDLMPQYRQILRYFQQTALQRPSSPWLWSYIASTKGRLGEFDEVMQQALLQAVALGPEVPWIQAQVAKTGFAYWEGLSEPAKIVVFENIVRGISGNRHYMLDFARQYNKLYLICRIADDFPEKDRVCTGS